MPGMPGLKPGTAGAILTRRARPRSVPVHLGVIVVAKYLLLFSLTGEATKRFIVKPSDRAAVVRELVESIGGGLESYYWMFGQYDGALCCPSCEERNPFLAPRLAPRVGADPREGL